jgi:L-lactate dehydrogenase complex protein LldE
LTDAVRASLFATCIVDQFYPEVGESTARVLEKLGVDLDFPSKQTCCGQPAFNSGFWNDAKPLAKRFLEVFEGDRYVVAPSGSCVSMVRVYYEQLLRDDPELRARAQAVSSRVYEFTEFIVDVLGVTDVPAVNASAGRKRVTYHGSCHAKRELGVDSQPRALLASLPGVETVEMPGSEVCCGFGGTFAVKYPEISGAMLNDKIEGIRATNAESVVACDMGCLMHIGGGMDRQDVPVKATHISQLIDELI